MRRCMPRGLLLALLAWILLAAGSQALCETQPKAYTVMFYICGSDLERDHGQETAKMEEILESGYNEDAIQVIGLLGGTPRWVGNRYRPDVLSVVRIGGDAPTILEELPLSPMCDPETLSSFLYYCHENAPAQHYILILCDHGGGPLLGCCKDDLYGQTMMGLNLLDEALADSPFADRGLDIIAFDCCLMGSAEIGNRLSPYAKYMVATEDAMYGLGHDWLYGLEKDESALETARRIADSTYKKNQAMIEKLNACQKNAVSVLDLQFIPRLIPAMDACFADFTPLEEATYTVLSGNRRDAVSFGAMESGGASQYDLADLGSLIGEMTASDPDRSAELLQAIRDAVPYFISDTENCLGMTVYHPYNNQRLAEKSMGIYSKLGFSRAYAEYLIHYTSIMTGRPLADWGNLLTGAPAMQKDRRILFTLSLTEEQKNQYSQARMKVLLREPGGGYRFTYWTNNTLLQENRITGEYAGTALYAVDETGNPLSMPLPYRVAENGTILIPAELTLIREEGGGTTTHQALIYCRVEPGTKRLSPGGVAIWDEMLEQWTMAAGAAYHDYNQIRIQAESRTETRDEYGVLLPFDQWEIVDEEPWESEINASWHFQFLSDTIDPTLLYATFEIQDHQGRTHASELHVVSTKQSAAEEIRVDYDDANLVLISDFSLRKGTNQLELTAEVTNLTDQEAVIELTDLKLEKQPIGRTAEAWGNGPNWGLLPEEKQNLTLFIPMKEIQNIDTLRDIQFSLVLRDAGTQEELGRISVEVTLQISLNK